MRFILGNRGSGVTTNLLLDAGKTGGVIICPTFTQAEYIKDKAAVVGVDNVYVVAIQDVINNNVLSLYPNAKIFVSDVEYVLRSLLERYGATCNVEAVSASQNTDSRQKGGTHQIELYYGYERSHDTYETYHAFEAADIEDVIDSDQMAERLAGRLDCTPDDEDFSWNSMYIALPEKTVERIKQEGRSEMMFAMFNDGPWRNDACKGYAIMAMKRAGLDDDTISKVSSAMTDCFDDTSVEEAGRYYTD